MFNIKLEDLNNFATRNTIEQGKKLADSNFFTLGNIFLKENASRYDTLIYSIQWGDSRFRWYQNTTQIEVSIDDHIVGFYNNCDCSPNYNKMCIHTVCLAFSIIKKNEQLKLQLGDEQFQVYENSLLENYRKKKAIHLENIRLEEIKRNKKIFSSVLEEYEQLTKSVERAEKVGLEVIITHGENLTLSLRVGCDKKYVVKNIFGFLNAIKNKELIRYGKQLEFYHDFKNFDEAAQKVIKILLLKTNYWSEADYLYDYSNRFRYMKLNKIIVENLFSNCLNSFFTFIKNGIERQIYISDKTYTGKLYIDEERIALKDLKKYQIFLGESKNFIEFDNTVYELKGVSDNLKPIYNALSHTNYLYIKDSLSSFLKEVYPLIYDEVEVEYSFKESHPVKQVKIDSYFDLENNILELQTRYYLGDKEVSLETLNMGIYSYSKLQEYQNFLKVIGFVDNKVTEFDKIMLFLKSDLSLLKRCGDVFLSDTITKSQIRSMRKITFNMSYDVDVFSVFFDDLGFSDEELLKIVSAYRKKKKYVKLNANTFVELSEKIMQEFVETIDDFNLNVKELNKVQKKPFYTVAKVLNKENNDYINYNYSEYLKEILDKIKKYKDSSYQVPESLQGVLRGYQVEAFKWLKTHAECNLGGILADDMGLGKTLEIISFLISDEKQMPTLIICPTSLVFNWQSEILKWDSTLAYQVIAGTVDDRRGIIESIEPKKKIYITSYDTFKNDVEFYKEIKFRFVILDEAQFIKNYYTQKAQAVKETNSEVRFVLTGTPIENSLLDLWSIFDFLLPDYLSNHSNFKSKYEKAITSGNNQELLQTLIKKITPFVLRRTKKSVLKDLPDKIETISYAQMDDEQRKVYEAQLMLTKNLLNSGKTKFEVLSSLTRLRQICVDPSLYLENYHGGSAKIDLALDIIQQSIANGHKILLFSQFTSLFPALEVELKKLKFDYYVLTGSTKSLERVQLVDDFNENEEVKVFLISLKAGGTGLNLTGANVIIHFDPWWNLSVENQATDRAHRIGQKRSVHVIKLVCENSIEQKVIELQNLKKDLADRIIMEDDQHIEKLEDDDLKYLLS